MVWGTMINPFSYCYFLTSVRQNEQNCDKIKWSNASFFLLLFSDKCETK